MMSDRRWRARRNLARRGNWVYGFVCYDAAPAFDAALRVREVTTGIPLIGVEGIGSMRGRSVPFAVMPARCVIVRYSLAGVSILVLGMVDSARPRDGQPAWEFEEIGENDIRACIPQLTGIARTCDDSDSDDLGRAGADHIARMVSDEDRDPVRA